MKLPAWFIQRMKLPASVLIRIVVASWAEPASNGPIGFCCSLTLGCPFLHHRWPSEALAGVNFITSSHCKSRLERERREGEKKRKRKKKSSKSSLDQTINLPEVPSVQIKANKKTFSNRNLGKRKLNALCFSKALCKQRLECSGLDLVFSYLSSWIERLREKKAASLYTGSCLCSLKRMMNLCPLMSARRVAGDVC